MNNFKKHISSTWIILLHLFPKLVQEAIRQYKRSFILKSSIWCTIDWCILDEFHSILTRWLCGCNFTFVQNPDIIAITFSFSTSHKIQNAWNWAYMLWVFMKKTCIILGINLHCFKFVTYEISHHFATRKKSSLKNTATFIRYTPLRGVINQP